MSLLAQYLLGRRKPSFEVWFCLSLSLVILFYAFSPFRMERNFIFQIQTEALVVITILSWIGCAGIFIRQIYTSSILKTITVIDLLLFAVLVYLLLQLIFYPVDTDYLLTIACLAVAYFLFRHIPVKLVSGLLILLPAWVVVQIIYGYNRFEYPWQTLSDNIGAFNNTGIFGGFVAMGFVSALGLLLSFKKPVARITLGVLLIPLIVQLIYSHSRAAWIAAAVGTVVLLSTAFRQLTKRKAALFILALLIVGSLISIKLYHFKKDSADGRLLIWTVSWNMMKEKPLTGFGPCGFRKNYLLRQGDYFKNNPDSSWTDLADDTGYPFNEFLKTGIEQGAIRLLFMIGIFFLAFKNTASPLVLRAVLAALIGFSCFSYPFDVVAFQVLCVFCLAGIASTHKPTVIVGLTRNPLKFIAFAKLLKFIAICLVVALCGFISFVSCKYYVDVKKWNQIIRSYSPKDEKQPMKFQALYRPCI